MIYQIKISQVALRDIQIGADYYNRQQKGLGKRFEQIVNDTFRQIQVMPEAASFAYDTVRYKIIDKFPYIVTFELEDSLIIIYRVFNTYLSPDTI